MIGCGGSGEEENEFLQIFFQLWLRNLMITLYESSVKSVFLFIDSGDEELYRSTEHCCIVTVNKAAFFDLFEANATGKCCPRESRAFHFHAPNNKSKTIT